VSFVDQAVIDLVEGVSIWGVQDLEVDSCVHEVRTFDHHLLACGKVNQSEAIFICTFMQAVIAYRWLMYGFPANLCVRVNHHQHDLGSLRMPAPAVQKIDPWPPLLSHLLVHVC
jgi:hypothetical protein